MPAAEVRSASTAGTRLATSAHTLIVLPPIGDRPRLKLEHMILHALILAAAICTFVATAAL